ncbi:uncharacterized protein F5147DRAFT_731633, partial [Suillus discolor]
MRRLAYKRNLITSWGILPTFDDQEMLPQVTAFMLGSLRWRPVNLGGMSYL